MGRRKPFLDITISSYEGVFLLKKWLDKFRHIPIIIDAEFMDRGKIENVHEKLVLDDFLLYNLVVYDDIAQPLNEIAKATIKKNDQYYPIQKSLDIIAKYVENLKRES